MGDDEPVTGETRRAPEDRGDDDLWVLLAMVVFSVTVAFIVAFLYSANARLDVMGRDLAGDAGMQGERSR